MPGVANHVDQPQGDCCDPDEGHCGRSEIRPRAREQIAGEQKHDPDDSGEENRSRQR